MHTVLPLFESSETTRLLCWPLLVQRSLHTCDAAISEEALLLPCCTVKEAAETIVNHFGTVLL